MQHAQGCVRTSKAEWHNVTHISQTDLNINHNCDQFANYGFMSLVKQRAGRAERLRGKGKGPRKRKWEKETKGKKVEGSG